MRTSLAVFCGILAFSGCLAAPTQIPKLKTVPYEGWGFELSVPRESRKLVLEPKGDILLWDIYAVEDFAYFVKIAGIPPDSLTSTVIEQDIQADSNLYSRRGATRRWEMSSEQGELFKGLNHYAKVDQDLPEAAVELGRILKGRTAYVCSALTPLGDETSPMLIVGVIGPKGRDGEVDALAKFFVHGVRKTKASGSAKPSPAPGPPSVAVPARPSAAPSPPPLRKGQIRIVGTVDSIDSDGAGLVMTAEEISTVNSGPVNLDPRRSKKVLLESIPGWLDVGARIVVIGPNSGVGVPIKADYIGAAPR